MATFSLWKLKNTNLPKKRESPVLRLMTKGVLSSALTTPLDLLVVGAVMLNLVLGAADLVSGLRPWKDIWVGESCGLVMEGERNKVEEEEAAIVEVWLMQVWGLGDN